MKPTARPVSRRALSWCAFTLLLAGSAASQTILLTDSFDESPANEVAETFNANLAATQGGTLAPATYNIHSGNSNAAQHGNGGSNMTLATFPDPDGRGFGRVSLANDFATQANAADQPLQVSFTIGAVFGYTGDPTRWVSFSIGSTANQFITDHSIGVLFRANGATQTLAGGTQLGGTPNWNANDLVTITLSGTGGLGSAFGANGSEATIQIGANTIGTFALPQQTSAFMTFSAYNDVSVATGTFGGANIDNLSISLVVPNPDYDTWAESFTPTIGLPAADDDNDGLSNEQEYAFGLLPDSGASVNPIAVPLDKATGTFSYTRRDATLTPLNYSVWFSTDLTGWTEDTGTTEGVPVLSGDVETVPVTLSSIPGDPLPGKLFIQVRAD
jgi:hypothetical protein